jgi:hypothetical protein
MGAMAHPPPPGGTLSRRDLLRFVAGSACGAAGAAELGKLLPVDEASRDPGLFALIGQMRRLAARRDSHGLEALMLPTFRVEFDAGKGPAAYRRRWHPESPSTAVWGVLERLFSLGGTFYSETLFAMPYVYTKFPVELDPLGHVVAVKAGTRILDRPGHDGKPLGTLDYAIIPLAERLQPPVMMTTGRYLEARVPSVGRCYVAEADVYSPAAHRTFFERRGGRWRWISLACATLADPPELTHTKQRK